MSNNSHPGLLALPISYTRTTNPKAQVDGESYGPRSRGGDQPTQPPGAKLSPVSIVQMHNESCDRGAPKFCYLEQANNPLSQ